MQDEWKSFIGWSRLPDTPGMTVGEIARFYAGELKIGCDLHVVAMEGWTRDKDTGVVHLKGKPGTFTHERTIRFTLETK